MRTNVWAAAGALAALAVVTGCGTTAGDRACTLMGSTSGLSLTVHPEAGMRYELCAHDACDTKESGTADNPILLSTVLPDSVGASTITVHLTGTPTSRTQAPVDETAQIPLRKFQPNGAGCGPTVYRAELTWQRGQHLRPR